MKQLQKPNPVNEQIPSNALSTSGQQSYSNQVGRVMLYGMPIVSLIIESQERLCLAQISNTLLKQFSYNEIHNRRVALGITCVQCTPVQLEILRRAGAMPVSSRRCGMITRREAERLCKSFLGDNSPPRLPEDFAFAVHHECAWGCRGSFMPSRYNSSRAKCIKCTMCGLFFSPNKFIFHSHRISPSDKYVQPDAANFNSWRRHMKLSGNPSDDVIHAWEDVKAMFNGGTRKRLLQNSTRIPAKPTKQMKIESSQHHVTTTATAAPLIPTPRIPTFQDISSLPISRMAMDFMYNKPFAFGPYTTLPWLKRNPVLFPSGGPFFTIDKNYQSAFKPVHPIVTSVCDTVDMEPVPEPEQKEELTDDEVDIETTDDKDDAKFCPKPDTLQATRTEAVNVITEISNDTPTETPNSTPTPTPIPASTPNPTYISRLSIDSTERNNILYHRHEFQRHFIVNREESALRNSPIPLSLKPIIDCTACQNHHNSLYTKLESNSKLLP